MKLKALVLFVAMSVGLSAFAFAADEAPAPAPEPIKYGTAVGDNIQPVTISSVDGSLKVDISKGQKRTVFVLVSSVCTACRKEIQELTANFETLKDKIDIYAVSVDMDPQAAAARFGNMPFPLLTDKSDRSHVVL